MVHGCMIVYSHQESGIFFLSLLPSSMQRCLMSSEGVALQPFYPHTKQLKEKVKVVIRKHSNFLFSILRSFPGSSTQLLSLLGI